jgi:hypothetical protein
LPATCHREHPHVDADEDVTDDLDLTGLRRSALEQRRVNVDFSPGMIEPL